MQMHRCQPGVYLVALEGGPGVTGKGRALLKDVGWLPAEGAAQGGHPMQAHCC